MNNGITDTPEENIGNLGQIRDILFGQQMRDFGDRFSRLETELSQFQQDMQGRLDQVRDAAASELRAAVDAMDKQFKTLSVETQEERADLERELTHTRDKLSKTIEVLDESLERQTTSMRDDLRQTKDRLHDEVRDLKTYMLNQLESYVSNLQDAKVSRDAMAELLFEMGMRLKGAEVMSELQSFPLHEEVARESEDDSA